MIKSSRIKYLPEDKSAKEIIEEGDLAECWICAKVFGRLRPTERYCQQCGRGFCEGEHGSFAQRRGLCVICGACGK